MNEKITIHREELYEQVWSKPMIVLAKEYGLSDNGLRKICKKLGIPLPKIGHWVKVEFGKKVTKAPLPTDENYPTTYELTRNKDPHPKPTINVSPELQKVIDFEEALENRIRVPQSISKPHPLVKQTRINLKSERANYNGLLQHTTGCLNLNVSKGSLSRGLRIFNTIILALAKRSIRITIDPTAVQIWGESISFGISEKVKQRDLTDEEIEEIKKKDRFFYSTKKYTPSGILTLKVYGGGSYGPTKEFKDGKKIVLEDKLNDFVVSLYSISEKVKQDERERLIMQEKYRQAEFERYERERRISLENEKIDFLIEQAEVLQKVKLIKDLIESVKEKFAVDGDEAATEHRDQWIDWATQTADRLDPLSGNFFENWNERFNE